MLPSVPGNPYIKLGPLAVAVWGASWALHRQRLRDQLRPCKRLLAVGVAVGSATTLLTYVACAVAFAYVPQLETPVRALYETAGQGPLLMRLGLVVVILSAEELLFRGLWFDVVRTRKNATVAAAVTVGIYVAVVSAEGSWIVSAVAALLGTLWTWMRVRTHSLVPSLVAHAIWTPVVIVLVPVLPPAHGT